MTHTALLVGLRYVCMGGMEWSCDSLVELGVSLLLRCIQHIRNV